MNSPPLSARSALPADLAAQVERICNRYETALLAGRRPDIARVLRAVTEAARPALEAELRALELAYQDQVRVVLTVTEGPHVGRTFAFAAHDTFMVGRSKQAHFRLSGKDQYFSRFHFLVEMNPPCCRLFDLASRNGTYVNGQRVKTADLHDGDLIKAGHTILRFALLGGVAAQPMPLQIQAAAPTIDDPGQPASIPLDVLPPIGASPSIRAIFERSTVYPSVGASPPAPAAPALDLKVSPIAAACRCCGAVPASPAAPGFVWPLCAACLDSARGLPQNIPGYLLVRKIGSGGMGIVFEALRATDGARVAVKTIAPAAAGSKIDFDRFLREARILRDLHHQHIVAFEDMGEANGQLFFAMEFVAGPDARRLLKVSGPLPVERALRLVCQLLEALEFAHEQGYVHRDIKPANVLVATEGDREIVKLADFGLARVYQSSNLSGLTLQGDVGGSIAFMAPEQILNFREAKPAADQYAAAATFYNLLTNRCVFDLPADFQEQIRMILEKPPVFIGTRRRDIPQNVAALIHRALAKDPAKRFKNVRAFRRELLAIGTG